MTFQKFETSHPWEKPKEQLTQFDWLTAVGLSGQHRTTPTDLRVAQELTRFASNETCIAWPTVETLVQYVGCHRSGVSKSISNLKQSGALLVQTIGVLPDEYRSQIKRKGRGNAYFLNIEWAYETLSVKPFLATPEPAGLKKGRLSKQGNVADAWTLPTSNLEGRNVATHATSNVATHATLQCSGHGDTKIDKEIEGYRLEAGKKGNLVSRLPEQPTSRQVDNLVKHTVRGLHAFQGRSAA